MLNNASKFALGVTGLAAVAFVGTRLADGDRVSAIVLVGLALAAAIVAVGIAKSVGADLAPFAAPDATPASTPIEPTDVGGASYGPLFAGVGATVAVAGGAVGPYWVLIGGLATALGIGIWLFDTFRAPGALAARDAANVDSRFLGPLALPLVSAVTAITIAYCLSRVLLAVNETASYVIAFIVAAATLTVLSVIAAKQPATKVVAGLAGVGAVAVLLAGGTFAGVGEREFESHATVIPEATITAQNIAFDRKIMALPADTDSEIIFTNLDVGTFHNVAVYTQDQPGTPIYNGKPSAKGTQTYKFHTPSVGTYRYVCDFHPAMVGELRVTEASSSASANASEKESEH
jgi:plastocyanin